MGLQSIVTPKALMPLVTQRHEHGETNDVVQPALNILLDQLLASDTGIEKVCVVAAPNQLQAVVSFLSAYELMHFHSDSKALKGLHQSLSGVLQPRRQFLDGRIGVVIQHTALGFGDAVLCARDFVGDESFLVALGDHVFTPGCIQQVVGAYQRLVNSCDQSLISTLGLTGACVCDEKEVPFTGLLQFDTDAAHATSSPSVVVAMAEKPREYSQFALSSECRSAGGKYLSQLVRAH
jgi:UTP--glucose-1-phosphate uridylyltransferase